MSNINPILGNIFVQSGIFSYVILAVAIGMVVTFILQLRRMGEADYSPVLWGLVAAMFLAGVAGTITGHMAMFQALQRFEGQQLVNALIKGYGISVGPMVMATPLAMLGAIGVGITSYKARRVAVQ
ncbi:MAG: hypothetical protein ABI333_22295 [bacterium]